MTFYVLTFVKCWLILHLCAKFDIKCTMSTFGFSFTNIFKSGFRIRYFL